MPIMYCNFNMFDMSSPVLCIAEGEDSYPIFRGSFEEVCDFMATEYQTNKYNKIILAGPYATTLEDRVRTYALINYNNVENINIEVIK